MTHSAFQVIWKNPVTQVQHVKLFDDFDKACDAKIKLCGEDMLDIQIKVVKVYEGAKK